MPRLYFWHQGVTMLEDNIDDKLLIYNSPYLIRQKSNKKSISVNWHIKKVIDSSAPNILVRGGYGAGKSKFLVIKGISLLKRDKVNILIMTTIYGYIHNVLMPYCIEILEAFGLPFKLNIQNKHIFVPGAGYIYFFSYANPPSLVSLNVGHILLDEFDEQDKEKAQTVFEKANARKRLKIKGNKTAQTIIATTPRGIGSYCYDLFEISNINNKDFSQFEVPTFANYKNLRESYVREQMSILPENKVLSHILGKWAPATSQLVYDCYSEDNNISENHQNYPSDFSKLLIGMDFNVGKMAAVIGVEVIIDNRRCLIIIDEVVKKRGTEQKIKNTEEMIKELKLRYPDSFLICYPDYAGNSETTKCNDTDVSLLKASGIRVITKVNPFIKDRVNVVNSTFKNALHQTTVFINKILCHELTIALTSQGYDKFGKPDKTQGHDHILDALGYLIYNRIGKTQIAGYK